MKKVGNIIMMVLAIFIFSREVLAIDASTPVESDTTLSKCNQFQTKNAFDVENGFFGHCVKASCYNNVWKLSYSVAGKTVTCKNRNFNYYSYIYRSGCGIYQGSCTGSAIPKYCTEISYYDCDFTTSGLPFVPPTTTTKAPPLPPPTTPKPWSTTTTTTRRRTTTTTRRASTPTTGGLTTQPTIDETTLPLISNNNFIESLVIENIPLNFNKNINDYTINLDPDIKSLKITVLLEDDKASYVIENNTDINMNNPIKIIVTAEDESVRTYYITLKKPDEVLDSNSKLRNLIIKGYSINFEPNTLTYDVTIISEDKLDITATADSDKASIYISGNNNLKNRSKIYITIKAEDSTETIYTINIKKDSNISNVLIIILMVGIAGFVGYKMINRIKNKEKAMAYEYE